MDARHVRTLQREVNRTLHGAELDWLKIPEDGKFGPLTLKHARIAGSWQGFSPARLRNIGEGKISSTTFNFLTHRRKRTSAMQKRHKQRLKHFKALRYHHAHPPVIEGLVEFDGHQVPAWIAAILKKARAAGYWTGYVISGVRSPAYSEHLCIIMCGAPTCPGRCGGRYSNHACPPSGKGVKYEGAVDVTDPAGLGNYCSSHNEPLRGDGEVLPDDLNHFSHEGN
jgi:hypothetical protein